MPNRINFVNELETLISDVQIVGVHLKETLDKVIKNLDDKNEILARKIIENDKVFNKNEHDIEQKCLTLVLKQAPVASDWREIASIMKMISDIERIADHCADISKYTSYLAGENDVKLPDYFFEMVEVMRKMFDDSLICFSESNVELAYKIIETDSIVDKYFSRFRKDIAEFIKENPDNVKAYIDYLMIGKYIERIADHTTNIAEWIIYIVKNELK